LYKNKAVLFEALLYLFFLKQKLVGCGPYERGEKYSVRYIGQLDAAIKESSGIGYDPVLREFAHISDSGNEAHVYLTDADFGLVGYLPANASNKNIDFEDLSTTKEGIVIADLGNNSGHRAVGSIYNTTKETQILLNGLNFEAMVVSGDTAFVFSKERNKTRAFSVKLNGATSYLMHTETIKTRGYITGAALNAAKTQLALLSYSHVVVFGLSQGKIKLDKPLACIKLAKKQTEAICFVNETDMVVTNENRGVYMLSLAGK
jgi:hypothetical protein